ncbi:MAG: hypothetical protein WCR27_09940 [Eubacteriales bacterium]
MNKENDRGSALLAAIVAVVVLGLIASTFFAISANRSKMESSEEKGLKAYYLAEAGIQYGVAAGLEAGAVPTDDVTEVNPFGSDYGGSFTVQWTDNGTTVTINSTGEYFGVERSLEALFSLE